MEERDNRHGMTLNVYRQAWSPDSDFTLGGISSRFTNLSLVGTIDETRTQGRWVTELPAHMRVFAGSEDRPAVAIVLRRVAGLIVHVSPVQWNGTEQRFERTKRGLGMSGGNYADTGDSRVSDLVRDMLGHPFYGAMAIHDRFEG